MTGWTTKHFFFCTWQMWCNSTHIIIMYWKSSARKPTGWKMGDSRINCLCKKTWTKGKQPTHTLAHTLLGLARDVQPDKAGHSEESWPKKIKGSLPLLFSVIDTNTWAFTADWQILSLLGKKKQLGQNNPALSSKKKHSQTHCLFSRVVKNISITVQSLGQR